MQRLYQQFMAANDFEAEALSTNDFSTAWDAFTADTNNDLRQDLNLFSETPQQFISRRSMFLAIQPKCDPIQIFSTSGFIKPNKG